MIKNRKAKKTFIKPDIFVNITKKKVKWYQIKLF